MRLTSGALLALIGAGGMGEVDAARDGRLGRLVARAYDSGELIAYRLPN